MTKAQQKLYKRHLRTIRDAHGTPGTKSEKPWGEGVNYAHIEIRAEWFYRGVKALSERFKPVERDRFGNRI